MSRSDQIVMAQPQDIDALSDVIAQAFHTLAPSVWLIPDESARREILPGYFRLSLSDAMVRGSVYTTAGRTAAALWFPVSEAGGEGLADYDEALAAATGRWVDRFRMFDALLEKRHPAGLRHDHLAILAVRSDHQHRGLGTALLNKHHRRLDESHRPTPTYLEASDARTRGLYLRRGYGDLGDPIELPDRTPMYPMLRQPVPAGPSEENRS